MVHKRQDGKSKPKMRKSSNQVSGVYMPSLQRTQERKKKNQRRSQYLRLNKYKGVRSKPSARPQARDRTAVFLRETGPRKRPLPLSQATCSARCIPLNFLPGLLLSTQMCSRISVSQKNPIPSFDD